MPHDAGKQPDFEELFPGFTNGDPSAGAIDDLVLVRDFTLSLLAVICDKTAGKRFPKPRQTTPKKMKPPSYGTNLTMVRINRSWWLGPASLRFL